MKKSTVVKILCLALSVMIMTSACLPVFAADLLDPSQVQAQSTNASTKVNNVMGQALGIAQVIAMGVAVIMLIVLAMKYISASPSEKADIKKGLTIYIVGAILLFGATAILQVIKGLTGQALN